MSPSQRGRLWKKMKAGDRDLREIAEFCENVSSVFGRPEASAFDLPDEVVNELEEEDVANQA